ncbi:MAG: hypothetical protein JJT94_14235 [Bernardetiaceae bacterium]|nr:hypothetical protein [Bernardetiaceae bacterium]
MAAEEPGAPINAAGEDNNPSGEGGGGATSPDDYVFNEKGDSIRVDKNEKPDQIVIENSQTGEIQGRYDFNDPINDAASIPKQIDRVVFISSEDISQQMIDNGSTTTKENSWVYIERESRPKGTSSLLSGKSSGLLDQVSSNKTIVKAFALHLVAGNGAKKTGIAYNDFDFGNFLWGQAGKKLGFSIGTLLMAAHLNNAVNGRSDNADIKPGVFDSPGDQRAIQAGFYYPNNNATIRLQDNPGSFKPWERKY